ncbi:MAG: site-2 protease family protein [Solirubrobacteraceae bacterium]
MTRRRTSIQLARIAGISVNVGASWFIVLFLYIIWLEPVVHELLGQSSSSTSAYLLTVAAVLAFYLSIVLHELGHALAARRNGVGVAGIELWALGGITRTVGAAPTPSAQFEIAAAGPAVTVLLAGLCALAGALLASHQEFFAVEVLSTTKTTALGVWLKMVLLMECVVLALNLVPAFPLDGGQMVQAAVWRGTGDRNRATRATGRVGQGFALAMGAFALFLFSKSYSFDGLMLLVIAMFVYQGAGAAVMQGSISQRLSALTVADVMDREPVTVPAQTTLLEAQERYFNRYEWPWFAVVDPSRRFLGVLTRQRTDAEIAAGRPALAATDALDDDLPVRIAESQPLESLLRSEALGRLGGMVAVDGEGTLRGVITLAQVRQALRPAS